MEDKKVGIVLVNYNGSEDTLQCLRSLLNITYKNIMIVVVDNLSTDDSVEILKRKEQELCFTLLCSPDNNGFSAGNNIGIHYALDHGCSHILLLNNDTVVTPDFLSELMKYNDGETALTGTILYYWKREEIWYGGGIVNKFTGKTVHLHKGEHLESVGNKPQAISFISGCEMLLPRQIIDSIGLMDEDYFLYGEDVDYSLRISKYGFDLKFVPTSIIYHKVNASTSKISKASQYYSARNRRLLIYRNLNWYQKITALIYTHIQTVHRMIHKRLTLKCVCAGIQDYYMKKFGKTERQF